MKVLRRVKEQLDEQARQRVDLEHLRKKPHRTLSWPAAPPYWNISWALPAGTPTHCARGLSWRRTCLNFRCAYRCSLERSERKPRSAAP